jgi:hypothetical protein
VKGGRQRRQAAAAAKAGTTERWRFGRAVFKHQGSHLHLDAAIRPHAGKHKLRQAARDRPKSHLRMDRHYKHVSKPLQAVGAPKGNQAGSPVTNGRVRVRLAAAQPDDVYLAVTIERAFHFNCDCADAMYSFVHAT